MALSPLLLLTSFGHVIAARRVECGLSQGDLAQGCGVAAEVVVAMEAGRHAPTLDELVALARVLRCDAADLIERTMAACRLPE